MGAPESNAGDDFQFWWAASRALALIEPGTACRRLTLEGLTRFDDPDDSYEVVDVGEYFAGDDFDSAERVVLSQLKYSTKRPSEPWTVSRICEHRTRRGLNGKIVSTRSLIADLAAIYALLLKGRLPAAVTSKVRISLVTNQPGDPLLLESVAIAAELVHSQGATEGRAALLDALAEPYRGVVTMLAAAVGNMVSSHGFCDFLTTLDLTKTGSLGRAALARSVLAGAAKLTPGCGPDSARRLFFLVRQEALPDRTGTGITAADVLAALGVGDQSDLYPAPPRLPTIPDPLPAPGGRVVANAIRALAGRILVAHGDMGVGKTTAMQQLEANLPPGSVVALYDCYGGGEYLNSGEERHTAPRFVTQMVNELAQRCGTPLLVSPPPLEEDLWRRLTHTLGRAVDTLDPGALLVLAVDAADNAAYASHDRGQRSFLPDLVRLPLPARVSLVLTARTHRVASLGVPEMPQVKLPAFDAATSAAHLRRYRPDATDVETADFHMKTGGNPRVQFYLLTKTEAESWDMPSLLAACVTTPEPLFDDIVNSAVQVSGADAGGRGWLALMLAVARPINTTTLAAALDVEPGAVVAFAHGLSPGVQIVDEKIQFRDENFETYVRGRVTGPAVKEAHGRLSDLFLETRTTDPDAAAHFADHLFNAGRFETLVNLVLDEEGPSAIANGFRRAEVQGHRLDLAALASAEMGGASVAVRLAVRAGDTAARVDVLSSLLESHLDLVGRYTDVDLLRTYALRQNREGWLAPILMRLAAVLARDPGRHTAAREMLDGAEAWLRRWQTSPEEETADWDINEDDVAAAAEARFGLDGLGASLAWLQQWSPDDFRLDATAAFAGRVSAGLAASDVRDELRARDRPPLEHAPFVAYFASYARPPEPAWVNEIVSAAATATPREAKAWHCQLVDVAARYGEPATAAALARAWSGPLPTRPGGFGSATAPGVAALRCRALEAVLRGVDLTVDDIVPPSLQPTDDTRRDDSTTRERQKWTETVSPLLAAGVLAARAATGRATADEVATLVSTGLAERTTAAAHRWFTFDGTFAAWAIMTLEAAVDTNASPAVIDQLIEAGPVLLRDGAPTLWLDLASTLSRSPAHKDRAADLCARAATHAATNVLPASDRLDIIAQAANIAANAAPAVGKHLFDQAVETASGINDHAAEMLTLHAELGQQAMIAPPRRTAIAVQLIDAAEAVAPYVTESRVVPYGALLEAAAKLDATVALATACRWDDEDRIRLASSLPAALLGSIDGGSVTVKQALAMDHLIESDATRLWYQLNAIDRIPPGAGQTSVTRLGLQRAAKWLRRDVPARDQPTLAHELLGWAAARGLDNIVQTTLEPVARFHSDQSTTDRHWRGVPLPAATVQELLAKPESRQWQTLAGDVETLDQAGVYGDELRRFIIAVVGAAPAAERVAALTIVADLPAVTADAVVSVLAECLERWRHWPAVANWARAALPELLHRHLPNLAQEHNVGKLHGQLRAFDDDAAVRRAILRALPDTRPQLTSFGWQNIARLLGRLCGPHEAAEAVTSLLQERLASLQRESNRFDPASGILAVPMLLWSAFGHPRRQIRWRAAHATRELLTQLDLGAARSLATAFISYLDHGEPGLYRDPTLHFYKMSAAVALLVSLQGAAAERSDVLVAHLPHLTQLATTSEMPHAQIRELARATALALMQPGDQAIQQLRNANQPAAYRTDTTHHHRHDNRRVSDHRRYDFDLTDTIPYWYAPLARVFDLPVDAVAERAERWILDAWGFGEDDWMRDRRELRDQRSYERMSHRQGSIPPEENLRLYLEYHAMMMAAGELIDTRPAVRADLDGGEEDPWRHWLRRHLPQTPWLADRRHPVPAESELFGQLPLLDQWEVPGDAEFDVALQLVDGQLSDHALVAGHTSIRRRGAYGDTYIRSALVAPDHASALQRALAAAQNPRDWKLPDEDEAEFEVRSGRYLLLGWLDDPHGGTEGLDKHDPYAHDVSSTLPMPGRRFREMTAANPDPTGLLLLDPDGAVIARGEQWADTEGDEFLRTTSGSRVYVARAPLLRHLTEMNAALILEVQIGRHRNSTGHDDYRQPRSRIYLIDSTGRINAR